MNQNSYGQPKPAHGFIPFSTRDVADGLGDWFLRYAGVRVENAHPVSDHLLNDFDAGLPRLARHFLSTQFSADSLRATPNSEIIHRALGTDDFVSALTSGYQRVVQSSFNAQVSGYRSLLREVRVKNFMPVNIPDHGGISALQERPEHSVWEHGKLFSSTVLEDVQVTTHGLQFTISREALINDSTQEITAALLQLGNVAALHLAASVASTLEATDTLSDGAAYFATSKGNLVEYASGGGLPSVTTLDTAGTKLWRRSVGDHVAGVAPRFLAVPPEISHTARVLAAATWDPAGTAGTIPQGRFDVVTLPHLTSTADWYLLGDPITAPGLVLLRLAGGSNELATLEQITVPYKDGITLRLTTDYKVVRASRVGVVKIKGA